MNIVYQIISKLYCVLSVVPAGMSMCLSWCCPRPAWWVMWTSSLSWMPTSSTFLRSRSLYWRTKHPGWAKSVVRTLLWDVLFMKAFNYCSLYNTVHSVHSGGEMDYFCKFGVARCSFCLSNITQNKVEYWTLICVWILLLMSSTETAVDRQISFPLSNVLHVNGERNGQPLLHDFTEDIQFMDIEETSGKEHVQFSLRLTLLRFGLISLNSFSNTTKPQTFPLPCK